RRQGGRGQPRGRGPVDRRGGPVTHRHTANSLAPPKSAPGGPAPVLDAAEIEQLLDAYRRLLPQRAADEHLEAVLSDAIAHPGSLLRAQLAWSLGRSLGLAPDPAIELAVAIEA